MKNNIKDHNDRWFQLLVNCPLEILDDLTRFPVWARKYGRRQGMRWALLDTSIVDWICGKEDMI